MGIILIGIGKFCLTTFLTEKIIIGVILDVAKWAAKRSSNTIDDEIVKKLQDAFNHKVNGK